MSFGGIEAGGTHWNCAVGDGDHLVPPALGKRAGVLGAIELAGAAA